ncbi:hypothetical protein BJ912DRAFT_1064418 [Pholiota molesta]|nr:hypothetical protein BJ912DRAFT_1064418 [Pholiota molesta]
MTGVPTSKGPNRLTEPSVSHAYAYATRLRPFAHKVPLHQLDAFDPCRLNRRTTSRLQSESQQRALHREARRHGIWDEGLGKANGCEHGYPMSYTHSPGNTTSRLDVELTTILALATSAREGNEPLTLEPTTPTPSRGILTDIASLSLSRAPSSSHTARRSYPTLGFCAASRAGGRGGTDVSCAVRVAPLSPSATRAPVVALFMLRAPAPRSTRSRDPHPGCAQSL